MSERSSAGFVRSMPWVFVLIWSTGFIVAKYGMPYAPAFKFLCIRYVFSLLCFGVWIAAALVYLYAFWPAQVFVVALFLALSGIERLGTALVGYLKAPPRTDKPA